MWRSSVSSLHVLNLSLLQKSCRPSISHHATTARCQSSSSSSSSSTTTTSTVASLPKSMEEAQTLEEIYKSIEEQSQLDDQRRTLENPTPYFSLLHYPSRASWRSSDHILGVPPPSNSHVHSLLAQTQFNILQHSERTNKQLKRTYKRIMETHKLLAVKRERERRLAANLSSPTTNKLNDSNVVGRSSEDSDGTIQDGRGRHVGDWIDKKNKKKKSRIIDSSETLCDDPSVALSLSMGLSGSRNLAADYDTTISNNINPPDAASMNVVKSANSANKLAKSKDMSSSTSSNERPVGYSAEQTLTNLRYRFGPNYSIVKRVLSEVQSLLGGNKPPPPAVGSSSKHVPFQPKRVLDFGCGVGSSSAAALDVFGVCRNEGTGATTSNNNSSGVEWIHSIDASKSMRDTTERVLSSVLQASPWEEEEDDDSDSFLKTEEDRLLDEELIKYEKEIGQLLNGGGKGGRDNVDMKRLERQRKRMAKWEHTWTKQSNALTRLTFGESIVDASSFYSDQIDQYKEDRPALPWQAKLDEQRRLTKEKKKEKDDASKQSSSVNQKKKQGSFDLILCSYTLSELPNVPSSLAASTLLWEKLAPNGILVFVEPGTPDGFGILRSVRSMLLECCPPPEIKDRRRRRREAAAAEAAAAMMEEAREKERIEQEDGNSSDAEDGEDVVTSASIPIEEDHDNWPEECHVIAPCTHNGSCPMSRHQRNHVKRNTRFGKYEAAAEPNEVEQDENGEVERNDSDREEDEDGDMNIQDLLSNWDYMTESDKDELKMMMGGDDDMSDDEAKAMLEYMESMEGSDSDEDDGDDSDSDDEVDEQEYYNIDQDTTSTESSNNKESSTMKQTDVFDTSFCSFVHKFPGGTSRKKGEKFTYLVLQKRVPEESNDNASVANPMKSEDESLLDEIDVAELMSNSVHHGQELKKEELQKRLQQKRRDMNTNGDNAEEDPDVYDTYHQSQYFDLLHKAVEVEDAFLDSNLDSLGLEMLRGDDRRKGWGRLIRAPLKRKGHVLIDYCSAGCGGCSKNIPNDEDDWFEERRELPDGTQGRITRQKVSRGWSARSAPGCYSAARRARWGGLWPDLIRIKLDEIRQKKERKLKNDS